MLSNAWIGYTTKGEKAERSFHIVGGYFFQSESIAEGTQIRISQIFGEAETIGIEAQQSLDRAGWQLVGSSTQEKPLEEDNRDEHGWTLIVKPGEKEVAYPESDELLHFYEADDDCPEIQWTLERASISDREEEMKLDLSVFGPKPDLVEVDWGMGAGYESVVLSLRFSKPTSGGKSSGKTIGPVNLETHLGQTLLKKYPRPEDQDRQSYTVSVRATGPRDCLLTEEKEINIEGKPKVVPHKDCPKVDWRIKPDTPAPKKQRVRVNLSVDGPIPEIVEIDWGLGNGFEAVDLKASFQPKSRALPKHVIGEAEIPDNLEVKLTKRLSKTYPRPIGLDQQSYQIVVRVSGPEDCLYEQTQELHVPGCPELVWDLTTGRSTLDQQEVQLNLAIKGPTPDSMAIDWGDGTGYTEIDPSSTHTHTYSRLRGEEDQSVVVNLKATGPDVCLEEQKQEIIITACPEISWHLSKEPPEGQEQTVSLDVSIKGNSPDLLEIDWGLGEGFQTVSPDLPASQKYPRPIGEDSRSYPIQLRATGPANCLIEQQQEISIPGCPDLVWDLLRQLPGPTEQEVKLDLQLSGPKPDKVEIDWGLGKGFQEIDPVAEASSNYPIPTTTTENLYAVLVRVSGPDVCLVEQEKALRIQGYTGCPEVFWNIEPADPLAESQSVTVDISIASVPPGKVEIDWGDGNGWEAVPLETAFVSPAKRKPKVKDQTSAVEPPDLRIFFRQSLSHTYDRPKGVTEQPATIQLRTTGPGDCLDVQEKQVSIAGCPLVSWTLRQAEPSSREQIVFVDIDIAGSQPDSMEIDWGQGAGWEPIDPSLSLKRGYDRPMGIAQQSYTLHLRSSGPGACLDQQSETVFIPGCPKVEWNVIMAELTASEQKVSVEINITEPRPDIVEIDWGLGQGWETVELDNTLSKSSQKRTKKKVKDQTSAIDPPDLQLIFTKTLENAYPRPLGTAEGGFLIQLRTSGPDNCRDQKEEPIHVPGCPKIEWEIVTENPSSTEQLVSAEIIITGPTPDLLQIDWGEGNGWETIEPGNRPQYSYTRPAGIESESYTILLQSTGPDSCEKRLNETVEIPGCPKVDWTVHQEEPTETTQLVQVDIKVSGPAPESVEIDWGIGQGWERVDLGKAFQLPNQQKRSPKNQTGAVEPPDLSLILTQTLERAYDRPIGKSESTHTLQLRSAGPGSCLDQQEMVISVPGCPKVEWTLSQEEAGASDQLVRIDLAISEPAPDLVEIDWGQGQGWEVVELTTHFDPESTSVQSQHKNQTTQAEVPDLRLVFTQSLSKAYDRPAGLAEQGYNIQLRATGPQNCLDLQQKQINIPGCPRVDWSISKGELTTSSQNVTAEVNLQGPKPDKVEIDWGMGKGWELIDPAKKPEHNYPRPVGKTEETYLLQIQTTGPGACIDKKEEQLSIAGCPMLEWQIREADLLPTEQLIEVEVHATGPPPEIVDIDWGLGNGWERIELSKSLIDEETPSQKPPPKDQTSAVEPQDLQLAYVATIQMAYPRPSGTTDQPYLIQLQSSGPDVCQDQLEQEIRVPGCPLIEWRFSQALPAHDKQQIFVEIDVNGPNPDQVEIDWGQGNGWKPIDPAQILEQTYDRPLGKKEESYTVLLRSTGPDVCLDLKEETFPIPGCPKLEWELSLPAPEPEEQVVHVDLRSIGPEPELVEIDWGLGAGWETVPLGPALHLPNKQKKRSPKNQTSEVEPPDLQLILANQLEKRYPRPIGKTEETYTIRVRSQGPDVCEQEQENDVSIPGCPLVEWEITPEDASAKEQLVKADIRISAPSPDKVEIDWGQGKGWEPVEITSTLTLPEDERQESTTKDPASAVEPPDVQIQFVASLQNTYERSIGKDHQPYRIQLKTTGPDSCSDLKHEDLLVPGCPEVIWRLEQADPSPTQQLVSITVGVTGPSPDRLEVDWGSGQGWEWVDPSNIKEKLYNRPLGEIEQKYTILLRASGPNSCLDEQKREIAIPGCPLVQWEVNTEEPEQTQQRVRVDLTITGPQPERVAIDWGLGKGWEDIPVSKTLDQKKGKKPKRSPKNQTSAVEKPDLRIAYTHSLEQTYDRPVGKVEQEYRIQLQTTGPGNCLDQQEKTAHISGCPKVEWNIRQAEPAATEQLVSAGISISGPAPELVEIDWGVGDGWEPVDFSPALPQHPAKKPGSEETSAIDPPDLHIHLMKVLEKSYSRPKGKEEEPYVLKLRTTGPNSCLDEQEQNISIPGCPKLEWIVNTPDPGPEEQIFHIEITVSGPEPDVIEIHWGAGSEWVPIDQMSQEHSFVRPVGLLQKEYDLQLRSIGPGSCHDLLQETVIVPGCPQVEWELTLDDPEPETQQLHVSIDLTGPRPDEVVIDWGLGDGWETVDLSPTLVVKQDGEHSPKNQTSAVDPPDLKVSLAKVIAKSYDRPIGKDEQPYTIRLETRGPYGCIDQKEAEILIAGCPLVKWTISTPDPSPEEQLVQIDVEIIGPTPDTVEINWGLGGGWETVPFSPPLTLLDPGKRSPKDPTTEVDPPDLQYGSTIQISHAYDRPIGKIEKEYPVQLRTTGPHRCETHLQETVLIPGCPLVEWQIDPAEPTATDQTVQVTIQLTGPKPDKIEMDWDLGQGWEEVELQQTFLLEGDHKSSPKDSTSELDPIDLQLGYNQTIQKTFDRPIGQEEKVYTVQLLTTGPNSCTNKKEAQISIPGCPLFEWKVEVEDPEPTEQLVRLQVDFTGPTPDMIEIDWGLGAGWEPIEACKSIEKRYPRPFGKDAESYTIQLQVSGPGCCLFQDQQQIQILGCPKVVWTVVQEEPMRTEQAVAITLEITGPDPQCVEIDWGLGEGYEIVDPTEDLHMVYPKPEATAGQVYSLKLRVSGPNSCLFEDQHDFTILGYPKLIWDLTPASPTSSEQVVNLEMQIEGPLPDSMEIDWGLGNGWETVDLPSPLQGTRQLSGKDETGVVETGVVHIQLSQTYFRPVGKTEEVFTFQFKVNGPHNYDDLLERMITVPGCPEIIWSVGKETPTASDQAVKLNLSITGPVPDLLEIDWDLGDGFEPAEIAPFYTQVFSRPVGIFEQRYDIKLRATGPNHCLYENVQSVHIPGCPRIILQANVQPPTPTHQEVRLIIQAEGPVPTHIDIDWGDNSTTYDIDLQDLSFVHLYERQEQDTIYPIRVITGDDTHCRVEKDTSVLIIGTCPVLNNVLPNFCETEQGEQKIKFRALLRGTANDAPNQYIWYWGDGSPTEVTEVPVNTHTFQRPADEKTGTYAVRVVGKGPDCRNHEVCSTELPSQVEVPGTCPLIIDMQAIYGSQEEMSQEITAFVVTKGPKPYRYLWDWGDGSPVKTTSVPYAKNPYPRPAGSSTSYTVKVSVEGFSADVGNPCSEEEQIEVWVEGRELTVGV